METIFCFMRYFASRQTGLNPNVKEMGLNSTLHLKYVLEMMLSFYLLARQIYLYLFIQYISYQGATQGALQIQNTV